MAWYFGSNACFFLSFSLSLSFAFFLFLRDAGCVDHKLLSFSVFILTWADTKILSLNFHIFKILQLPESKYRKEIQ
jgi:hypothetical protein